MNRPIRLLVLTSNYPRFAGDAAGIFVHRLNIALAGEGITPVVLAPHAAGLAESEMMDGIEIRRFRYGADQEETIAYSGQMQSAIASPAGLIRLRRLLRCWETSADALLCSAPPFDAIAAHWLIPTGVVAQRLLRRKPLPCILSSHGTDLRLAGKAPLLTRLWFWRLFHQLSAWTVVSSHLKQQAALTAPAQSERLHVVSMPHDRSIFRRDETIARDPKLVVSVARFTHQKRGGLLIDAFGGLADRHPASRLEMYGGGPLKQELQAKIDSCGLAGRITLFDAIPQQLLRDVYNRAGIVVLNSFREGFGLALSEGMLCGAAVVGTRSGGIVDIIEHEQTGLLAEEDSVTSLRDQLNRLLEDETLRDRLANKGRRSAEQRFTAALAAAPYAKLVRSGVAAAAANGHHHSS